MVKCFLASKWIFHCMKASDRGGPCHDAFFCCNLQFSNTVVNSKARLNREGLYLTISTSAKNVNKDGGGC